MIVQDLEINPTKKFVKINSYLSENFGIKINTNLDAENLSLYRGKLMAELKRLRLVENLTPKSSELSKYLLLIEGVDLLLSTKLRESTNDLSNIPAIGNTHSIKVKSPAYDYVIDGLSDYVVRNIEVGDDIDVAIDQAMREYRSSTWRFPDYEVEYDVRNSVDAKLAELYKKYVPEFASESMSPEEINKLLEMLSKDDSSDMLCQ